MEENENQADQANKELVESKTTNRHSHTYNEGRARLTVESQLDFLEKVIVTNDTIIAWPIRCSDPSAIMEENDGGHKIAEGVDDTGLQLPTNVTTEEETNDETNHPNVSVEVKFDGIAMQHPTSCRALDIQARVQITQKFSPGRNTQSGTNDVSTTEQKNAVPEVDNVMDTTNGGTRSASPIHSFKSRLAFCSSTDPNISGSVTIQGQISPDGRLLITPEGITTDIGNHLASQSGPHKERTEVISNFEQGELKSLEPGKVSNIFCLPKSVNCVGSDSKYEVQVQESCTYDQNPEVALEMHLSRTLEIHPTNQTDDTEHVNDKPILGTEEVQQLASPDQTEKEPLGLSIEQADGSRLNERLEMKQLEVETDIPQDNASPACLPEPQMEAADQYADNAENTALASETVNVLDQDHGSDVDEDKMESRVSALSNPEGPENAAETEKVQTTTEDREKNEGIEQTEVSGIANCPEKLDGVENVDNIQVVEQREAAEKQNVPSTEVDNDPNQVGNLPESDQPGERVTSVVEPEKLLPPEATAMEMEQSVEQQMGEGEEGIPTSLVLGATEQGEEGWAPTNTQEPQEMEKAEQHEEGKILPKESENQELGPLKPDEERPNETLEDGGAENRESEPPTPNAEIPNKTLGEGEDDLNMEPPEKLDLQETKPAAIRRLSELSASAERQFHEAASSLANKALENTVHKLEVDQSGLSAELKKDSQLTDEVNEVAELGERPSIKSREPLDEPNNLEASPALQTPEIPAFSERENLPQKPPEGKTMRDAEVSTTLDVLVAVGPDSDGVDSESSHSLQHFRYRHRRFYRGTGIVSEHATPTFSRHYEKGQDKGFSRTSGALMPTASQPNSPTKAIRSDGQSSDTQTSTDSSEYHRMTLNLLSTLTTTAELLKTQLKRQSNSRARKRTRDGSARNEKPSEEMGAVNAQNASCAEPEGWVKLSPLVHRQNYGQINNDSNKRQIRHYSCHASKDLTQLNRNYEQHRSFTRRQEEDCVKSNFRKSENAHLKACCHRPLGPHHLSQPCTPKTNELPYIHPNHFIKQPNRKNKSGAKVHDFGDARLTQFLHEAVEEEEIPMVPNELNVSPNSQTHIPVPGKSHAVNVHSKWSDYNKNRNLKDKMEQLGESQSLKGKNKHTKSCSYSCNSSQDVSIDCSSQSENSTHLDNEHIVECHQFESQTCHKEIVRTMRCSPERHEAASTNNVSSVYFKGKILNKNDQEIGNIFCQNLHHEFLKKQTHLNTPHFPHRRSTTGKKLPKTTGKCQSNYLESEYEDLANSDGTVSEEPYSIFSETTTESQSLITKCK